VVAVALAAVLAMVVAIVVTDEDGVPAPDDPGVLVLPVIPIGGDTADGLQANESARALVEQATAYGASGIRMTADMRWLCKTEECDLSPLEPVVGWARDLGLDVYLQVNSTPQWMDDRGRWYAPEEEDAERWADLFAQLVHRFGTDVAGYEVWNEPNYVNFWQQGPDPEAYADLLKAVWSAVEDVDPDVTLIGGVLSNNDLGYMSALSAALEERGGDADNRFFYDQLGVHPYAGALAEGFDPRLPAGTVEDRTEFGVKDMTYLGLERLRAQVAEDEGIEREVVVGEFGYDTTPGAWYHVPEPQRAEYLAVALEQATAWDWLVAFTPYSYAAGPEDGFAIRGTPSEAALQEAATRLAG
jgi:hypothetical protein